MRSKLLIGLVAALVLAFSAPAFADGHESQVYVVHGIPGATVDVWVNGDPFLTDFEPGTITDAVTLAAGTYEIEIYPAGSDPETTDAIISESPEVPGGANLSVVAHLDGDGNPTLSAFVNDTSELDGEARVTARHTAAAPEVDIRAGGDVLFENVPNGAEGSAVVPAGTYSVDVVPTGAEEPVVLGPADLDLAADTLTVAYAIGSLEGETLDLLVQTIAAMPMEVHSGTGGLADTAGFPTWAMAALAMGGALVIGSGARLATKRN